MRLFVALPLPPDILTHLQRTQELLQLSVPPKTVRWTPPQQMHLTLLFLGEVLPAQVGSLSENLLEAGRRHSPFSLCTDKLGCYPNARAPRIIWRGIRGDLDRLLALQIDVQKAGTGFGDIRDERAFSPHLTLGRLRGSSPRSCHWDQILTQAPAQTCLTWANSRIELIRSFLEPQGVRYEVLREIILA